MSLKQNDIYEESMLELLQEYIHILQDSYKTFDADKRSGLNGLYSVEEVEKAYNHLNQYDYKKM